MSRKSPQTPPAHADADKQTQNAREEELASVIHNMQAKLEEMEARLQEREEQIAQGDSSAQEREVALAEKVKQLQQMVEGNGTMLPGSGKRVDVQAGDHIGYYPSRGGGKNHLGGWFKVDSGQQATHDCVLVSVANKPFHYDSIAGAPYHSVQQTTVRQLRKVVEQETPAELHPV